jgi:hypothetical protein
VSCEQLRTSMNGLFATRPREGYEVLVKHSVKGWMSSAFLAAVFLCAQDTSLKAQSNSSEYAPLAGAPAPGERGAPPIPAIEPQAAVAPTTPAEPSTPPPAPSAPAVVVAPPPEPTTSPPAAVVAIPAPVETPSAATQSQPTPAEKAAEKKKAAQEKAAKKETKGERSASTDAASDDALPRGRVPEDATLKNAAKLPADDKGPRALNFIGNCLNNYDNCMQYVRELAEKIPKSDICFPEGIDQVDITEKVRKFITLRPAIHSQAANRVVTEALYGIYPCKRAATPARTAGAPKGAKAAQ